ncbi:MAG: MdtA/MuxA family multidrug efflux RND transporter periplasmic adaptor subunit [Usitatibacteraceae bacterium]
MAILGALGGGYWWYKSSNAAATGPADASKGAPAAAGAPGAPGKGPGGGRFGGFDPTRVQPVLASAAVTADLNVVQNGLGTVAALRVATVKARVDGLLQNVLFQEGQIVKAGDVLAEIDPKPLQVQLSQVEGQLARDQAQLSNAKLDLERYRVLLAQDSVSKQQLDSQESLVRQFEGTVKVDQAQVDNAKLQLSYTRVTAPIPGRTGLRQVDAGNIVRSSDTAGLVVITQIDPITVVFTIPQDNLQRVLQRLKAGEKLPVDAWDREQKNKLATGTLITVDNQIDTATGTIKLKAQFPNPDGLLFPNQFVNVRMVVDTKKEATVIPMAAIQRGAQGTIVYVVKEDKTVTLRPVKMGAIENDNVAIESGVKPGELVVTDGVDRLREGAKVEVTTPFVPRQRGPGDPSRRGNRQGKGGAPEAATKVEAAPAAATAPATAGTPATVKGGPAPTPAAKAAPDAAKPADAASGPPAEPPRGGGWREMSDEKKAELRKKMEGMTDEQKAEFRKKMRERAQQGGPN